MIFKGICVPAQSQFSSRRPKADSWSAYRIYRYKLLILNENNTLRLSEDATGKSFERILQLMVMSLWRCYIDFRKKVFAFHIEIYVFPYRRFSHLLFSLPLCDFVFLWNPHTLQNTNVTKNKN